MPAGGSSPITQRSAARRDPARAGRRGSRENRPARNPIRSPARPPASGAEDCRLPRRGNGVLRWIASAPSRAQAKIAARYPVLFGSHSATRMPSPTPAARSPAAARSTRSWKERRLNVPAASVTAAAAGSRPPGQQRAQRLRISRSIGFAHGICLQHVDGIGAVMLAIVCSAA